MNDKFKKAYKAYLEGMAPMITLDGGRLEIIHNSISFIFARIGRDTIKLITTYLNKDE